MITVHLSREDLARVSPEIQNLPGSFFAGASPLLRPFISKLEELLPPEVHGRGMNFAFGALRSHVEAVRAEERSIVVTGSGKSVEISRRELEGLIEERYPTFGHDRLNLPGLLFLQSGPALQMASLAKLRTCGVHLPDGRRTQRYIFHLIVVSLAADRDRVEIEFDLERLPSSSSLAGDV
ncbi:MAG: hypothetical protein JW986_06400 [Methanotrichaceae archaeon]|nr:hypothetical protein [Methanotrichaceae archaeon]